jgi:site-specific DNA recombinase
MKRAIGYTRISDEDQSNWSLQGQQQLIVEYCDKNSITLIETFTDDGQSAKNFDRADWKRLEEFVKRNHDQVDMLLVMAWSRFSRNTKEALNMIEQLEKRYHIRVVSIREPLNLHPDSPFHQHLRTQMIQFGELELNFIRDRTKFGIHQAQKSGRYISKAPRGYLNARNEANEPVIIVDNGRADLIRAIYKRFILGETCESIKAAMKNQGFEVRGRSGIQEILRNPVYMGFIRQISYYDDPEALVKGIHEAIVSEDDWWKAQAILNNKKPMKRTTISDDFPMRGVLKCFCNRNLTAAFSQGKLRKVGYYKCNTHLRINLNAEKLHDQFDHLLADMSLPNFRVQYLQEKVISTLKERLAQRDHHMQQKQGQISDLEKKIDSVEEKYFTGDLDKETYGKWKMRYHTDRSLLNAQLADLRQPLEQTWAKYRDCTDHLANLQWIFNKGTVQQKQAFIRLVFNNQLYYQEGTYRTPYILPPFAGKAALLAEKRLLIIDQPEPKLAQIGESAPHRSTVEPFYDLLHLFHQIKSA